MNGKLAASVLAVGLFLYIHGHHVHLSRIPAVTTAAHGSNVTLANQMAASYGWSGAQTACLDDLWTEESGFSSTAYNASSGATGIPQLLPAAHAIPANWSDPAVQIRWGLDYIRGRYGTPCAAWTAERSRTPNWY